MGMKIVGIILFLAGIWWAYIWRHDPAEGKLMRPVGFLAAASGFFMFFEGLKREIIAAIQKKISRGTRDKSERDQK